MKIKLQYVRQATQRKNRYFKTMLRKNLMLALTAVLITVPLVFYSCATIIFREMENMRSYAQMAMDTIDADLTAIQNMTTIISNDESIVQLRQMKKIVASSDYQMADQARRCIRQHTSGHSEIEEIFVYFQRSNALISSECIFSDAQSMETIYHFESDRACETPSAPSSGLHLMLPSGVLTRYSYTNANRKSSDSPIAFCYYIPTTSLQSVSFVILLKSSYVMELFPQFIRDQGCLKLTSGSDELLFAYSAAERQSILNWGLSYECTNKADTLNLKITLPVMAVFRLVRSVVLLFLLVTMAAFFLPIAAAYRMTIHQYAPIIEIMQNMEKNRIFIQEQQDKDDYVAECINSLANARSEACDELDTLRENLHRNTAMLLLSGATQLNPELTKDFPTYFVVVYGWLNYSDRSDQINESLLSVITLELLVQHLPCKMTIHRLSPDSFAFIYPIAEGEETQPVTVLGEILDALDNQFFSHLRLAVSKPTMGVENVYVALEQARTAIVQNGNSDVLIITPNDDMPQTMQFQNGISFYRAMLAGDQNQSLHSIEQMMTMDMFSRYGVRDLYEYLSDIICFAAQDTGCTDFAKPAAYSVRLLPHHLIENMERAAIDICEFQALQKASQRSEQRQELMDFIRSNLSKYDLSIQELSDHFHMSSRAVQTAIYGETGTTLANYLRNERMHLASKLLLETDMQVNLICDTVGFNTISAFHKAFKNAFGVSPGKYRENYKGRNPSAEEK